MFQYLKIILQYASCLLSLEQVLGVEMVSEVHGDCWILCGLHCGWRRVGRELKVTCMLWSVVGAKSSGEV